MIDLMKWMRSRSVQIALSAALYFTFAPILPDWFDRALYAFSLSMKGAMLWLLPFTVSFFIASAVSSFEKKAPLFLLTLLLFEALSNGCSVWYAYGCGKLAISPASFPLTQGKTDLFSPLWNFVLERPSWWSADKGTLFGVCLGLCGAFFPFSFQGAIQKGRKIAETILTRFFAPLIPLFITGFLAKMRRSSLLQDLWIHYGDLLLWLVAFLSLYLLFLFFVGTIGTRKSLFTSLKNLLPAGSVAITTGCSLSTMPVTIEGTAKNLENPELARAIIPATTNIQQVGDCIINGFLCFILYTHFHGQFPPLAVWAPFTLAFVFARFATAAVLGGAIFVMLPLYETYLHFNGEMIALILAFNVLLDPIVTCTNVMGNGALCQIFERVLVRVGGKLSAMR